jgi:hypothetical protein
MAKAYVFAEKKMGKWESGFCKKLLYTVRVWRKEFKR